MFINRPWRKLFLVNSHMCLWHWMNPNKTKIYKLSQITFHISWCQTREQKRITSEWKVFSEYEILQNLLIWLYIIHVSKRSRFSANPEKQHIFQLKAFDYVDSSRFFFVFFMHTHTDYVADSEERKIIIQIFLRLASVLISKWFS